MHVHILEFWGCSSWIPTCMFLFWFWSMNWSYPWAQSCILSCLRALEFMGTHACMILNCSSYLHLNLCSNWLTFGLDFTNWSSKTCYTLSFQVFSRKLAQKVEFWCVECLVWALKANLENPEFGFLARAKDFTIERPSFCLVLRSSDGMLAWA